MTLRLVGPARRPELGQADAFGVRLDVHQVGHEPRPFLQLNDGRDVGHLAVEAGALGSVLDGVAVELGPPAGLAPLDIPTEAARAEGARVEEELSTGRAVGKPQLMAAAAVPVGLGL